MTPLCANCSATIKPDTGQQYGAAWLDYYCLGLLATRGYLIGTNRTGGAGHPAYTPLTFQRNGHLVTHWAPMNYWKDFWHFRFMAAHVQAWLESLPDEKLQPFWEHKGKENEGNC